MATIQEDKDPLDGLSKSALKSEVHWWHGRALEMEIKAEKLQKLVWDMWLDLDVPQLDREEYRRRMHELGWKWPDECGES